MATGADEPAADPEGDRALRMILQGTASETGERFFMALVENLVRVLGRHGAWVTEYLPETQRLRALAFRMGDRWVDDYELPILGTPCQVVIEGKRLVHYPDRVIELYPDEPNIRRQGMVSYMGVPLTDLDGSILGHLAVMDQHPMPPRPDANAARRWVLPIAVAAALAVVAAWMATRGSDRAPAPPPSSGGCAPSVRFASARRSWGGWWRAPWTPSSSSTRGSTWCG